MGSFGIYFDTRYHGEKRLQKSRRKRDAGKVVSSERHFRATWSYMQTREQERGLTAEGDRIKLTEDQKAFNPLSPAARMSYFGLPSDPKAAWQQCQENATANVTFRYFEFGPDPALVETLIELGETELIRPLVVDGFYGGLQAYCADRYGAREPPGMVVAYHEKFDQYGRPQPHLHAMAEATLTNGDYERVELKLFKEQLAELRMTLDTAQGEFLDRQLPDTPWRDLYCQRHEAWEVEREQLERDQIGQEIEASLVAAAIIAPILHTPHLDHAELILMDDPPLDLSRSSDLPPTEGWVGELDWPPEPPPADHNLSEDDEAHLDHDQPEFDIED